MRIKSVRIFIIKQYMKKVKKKLITYISINQVKKCQCYLAIISNSILESIGCKTTIVPSCEALIQEFMDNPDKYNVIITNNTYSNNGSGEEVLKAVKKIKKNIKVIVLTVERNETKYFINVIGFDGYLEKPLDQRKAISVLTALIPGLKFNKVEPMYYIYNNNNKNRF